MLIDSFTHTASCHSNTGIPNQDAYAIHKFENSISIAVSDGCSSMEESHYTSMDVARNAVLYENVENILKSEFANFKDAAHGHATLVWANVTLTEITICMLGDGVWGIDQNAVMLDWNDIPPYPTYGKPLLSTWKDDCVVTKLGNIPEATRTGTAHVWKIENTKNNQFWISTDGVTKIGDLENVSREITALKNKNGNFLKRRLARWLKDKFILDDLTVVSILTGESDEH